MFVNLYVKPDSLRT